MSDPESQNEKEQFVNAREVLLESLNLRMGDSSEEAEAARQDLRVQISDLDKLIDGTNESSSAATSSADLIALSVEGRLSDISVIGDRFGFTLSDQHGCPLATFSYPTQSHAAGALCLLENALRDALIVRENVG